MARSIRRADDRFNRCLVEGGAKYFIVTDVDRDGTMQGANEDLLQFTKEFPTARIVASGGVRNLEDNTSLEGVMDSIVGKVWT